jgi:hypothetical protein
LGASEYDDGAGGEDSRSVAAAAADLVDDVFEVFEVADAGEGVGVAGEGEGFDDFGEVCTRSARRPGRSLPPHSPAAAKRRLGIARRDRRTYVWGTIWGTN